MFTSVLLLVGSVALYCSLKLYSGSIVHCTITCPSSRPSSTGSQ